MFFWFCVFDFSRKKKKKFLTKPKLSRKARAQHGMHTPKKYNDFKMPPHPELYWNVARSILFLAWLQVQ